MVISLILLIILNWYLSVIPFESYLGKIISLILLVIIASRSTIFGILGIILIINQAEISIENMSTHEKKPTSLEFRKKHCKKGKLMKGGKEIGMDKLAEAFPNIDFSKEKCNPCDESCQFDIQMGDEKISDEEKLRPRNSKEAFTNR